MIRKTIQVEDLSTNHFKFWNNLKEGYGYFETHQKLPEIVVSDHGVNHFN